MLMSNINSPLFRIYLGNLLLLVCCLFYLAWWIVVFKPNRTRRQGGTFFIVSAFITGITSILLISTAIAGLTQNSQILPIKFILQGGIVMFIIILAITTRIFHRVITSELLIIHFWMIMELAMIDVLYSNGHFGFANALSYLILIGITTVINLTCYVIYYRFNEQARYMIGMVPLVLAAICALVFLCCKFNNYMLI